LLVKLLICRGDAGSVFYPSGRLVPVPMWVLRRPCQLPHLRASFAAQVPFELVGTTQASGVAVDQQLVIRF